MLYCASAQVNPRCLDCPLHKHWVSPGIWTLANNVGGIPHTHLPSGRPCGTRNLIDVMIISTTKHGMGVAMFSLFSCWLDEFECLVFSILIHLISWCVSYVFSCISNKIMLTVLKCNVWLFFLSNLFCIARMIYFLKKESGFGKMECPCWVPLEH